ncbi:rab GTPase activator, putative [Plasmodium vinckei brucechwatti]|uniref:Rab GTPase activator, putative n=1 Tax=Plasmodium vinckei brucechwatti TaxID=119398 RepID=A0A6V7SP28_PLAVN|nr:rab GTPase activator, putative [Plasmodium vinckei brucechwatti]
MKKIYRGTKTDEIFQAQKNKYRHLINKNHINNNIYLNLEVYQKWRNLIIDKDENDHWDDHSLNTILNADSKSMDKEIKHLLRRGVSDSLKHLIWIRSNDVNYFVINFPQFYETTIYNTFGDKVPSNLSNDCPTFCGGILGLQEDIMCVQTKIEELEIDHNDDYNNFNINDSTSNILKLLFNNPNDMEKKKDKYLLPEHNFWKEPKTLSTPNFGITNNKPKKKKFQYIENVKNKILKNKRIDNYLRVASDSVLPYSRNFILKNLSSKFSKHKHDKNNNGDIMNSVNLNVYDGCSIKCNYDLSNRDQRQYSNDICNMMVSELDKHDSSGNINITNKSTSNDKKVGREKNNLLKNCSKTERDILIKDDIIIFHNNETDQNSNKLDATSNNSFTNSRGDSPSISHNQSDTNIHNVYCIKHRIPDHHQSSYQLPTRENMDNEKETFESNKYLHIQTYMTEQYIISKKQAEKMNTAKLYLRTKRKKKKDNENNLSKNNKTPNKGMNRHNSDYSVSSTSSENFLNKKSIENIYGKKKYSSYNRTKQFLEKTFNVAQINKKNERKLSDHISSLLKKSLNTDYSKHHKLHFIGKKNIWDGQSTDEREPNISDSKCEKNAQKNLQKKLKRSKAFKNNSNSKNLDKDKFKEEYIHINSSIGPEFQNNKNMWAGKDCDCNSMVELSAFNSKEEYKNCEHICKSLESRERYDLKTSDKSDKISTNRRSIFSKLKYMFYKKKNTFENDDDDDYVKYEQDEEGIVSQYGNIPIENYNHEIYFPFEKSSKIESTTAITTSTANDNFKNYDSVDKTDSFFGEFKHYEEIDIEKSLLPTEIGEKKNKSFKLFTEPQNIDTKEKANKHSTNENKTLNKYNIIISRHDQANANKKSGGSKSIIHQYNNNNYYDNKFDANCENYPFENDKYSNIYKKKEDNKLNNILNSSPPIDMLEYSSDGTQYQAIEIKKRNKKKKEKDEWDQNNEDSNSDNTINKNNFENFKLPKTHPLNEENDKDESNSTESENDGEEDNNKNQSSQKKVTKKVKKKIYFKDISESEENEKIKNETQFDEQIGNTKREDSLGDPYNYYDDYIANEDKEEWEKKIENVNKNGNEVISLDYENQCKKCMDENVENGENIENVENVENELYNKFYEKSGNSNWEYPNVYNLDDATEFSQLLNDNGKHEIKKLLWAINNNFGNDIEFAPIIPNLCIVLLVYFKASVVYCIIHCLIKKGIDSIRNKELPFFIYKRKDFVKYVKYVLNSFIKFLPKCYYYLRKLNFDLAAWTARCIQDGFARMLPFDFVLRIYGTFLFEGQKTLCLYCLALLKFLEDDILKCTNIEEIENILYHICMHPYLDINKLTQSAYRFKLKTKENHLQFSTKCPSPYLMNVKIKNFYRPRLNDSSRIINSFHWEKLWEKIPSNNRSLDPYLTFCTKKDGYNLHKLLDKTEKNKKKPMILILKTFESDLIGFYCPFSLNRDYNFVSLTDKSSSFLCTFNSDFKFYRWSGKNNTLMLIRDGLYIGGNDIALFIDREIKVGKTHHSESFSSPPLISNGYDFNIMDIEIWNLK